MKNTWHLQLDRKKLNSDEEKFPFSELYYRQLNGPDADVLYSIEYGNEMDDSYANLDLKELLLPGYLPVECGYCHLKNGGAYVAVKTEFRNLDVEMYNYWRKWRFNCSKEEAVLRYKLWCPGSHISETLDPGITIEDIGCGPETFVFIERMSSEKLFGKEELENSPIIDVFGSYAYVGKDNLPIVILHHTRSIEQGFEIRSRFWLGYGVENKQLVFKMNKQHKIDKDFPYLLAQHNANEMANLRSLLPVVWKAK